MTTIEICDSDYTGNQTFEQYPFVLSNFQKWALQGISESKNILVTAKTGSGKTLVLENALLQHTSNGKKVIITTPIKALSNYLLHTLTKKYSSISFGIITGDVLFNPDAQCVIMTTEILRNLLYNKKIKTKNLELTCEIDVYQDVGCICFDEVHYIGDRQRGTVWEECLILIPPNIQLVMLSATLDKPEKFGGWLQNIKGVPLMLTSNHKRVIPLKYYLYLTFLNKLDKVKKSGNDESDIDKYKDSLTLIMDENNTFLEKNYTKALTLKKKYSKYMSRKAVFNDLIKYLHTHNMCPAIFFTLSRKNCEVFAKNVSITLNSTEEQSQVITEIGYYLRKLDAYDKYIQMKQFFTLKDLMVKGIAFHHSGLVPVFKELIEILFGKGLIKVLFVTETFAVGINMPVKTVCYSGITKYSDGGFRYLKPHEFGQMSGRAGRRGMDPVGNVILIPNLYNLPSPPEMRDIMSGKNQEINSRFTPNFKFLLKLILTGNNLIMKFVKNSLLNTEILDANNCIEEKLNQIKLPDQDFSLYQKYHKLLNPKQEGFIRFSNKLLKKWKKEADKIRKNTNDFDKNYQFYLKNLKTITRYENLKEDFDGNNLYVHRTIIKCLRFLREYEYINPADIDNYEEIGPELVTIKGVIASQINETNEILFTEIMNSDILNNLEAEEIVSLMSIFLNTKLNAKEQVETLSDISLPINLKSAIKSIEGWSNECIDKMNRLNIYFDQEWDLNYNMIEPTYLWLKGKDINMLTQQFPLYEGNFIKDMVKLSNVAEDIIKMANLLEKNEIASKVSTIIPQITRGVVNVESLYIKL
jgi:superfamily II RNA helicase